MIFNITIDSVIRQTTQDNNRGMRWNLFINLDDLDFPDDLALLSHTHSHVQEKTNILHIYVKQVGLKINKKKTEIMTLDVQDPAPVKVEDDPLPYTEQFTYFGCTVIQDGGVERMSSATELVRPGMPSGCLTPCGNHRNARRTQS